jgi:hypothetical protein
MKVSVKDEGWGVCRVFQEARPKKKKKKRDEKIGTALGAEVLG